jgi:hypothetical protein
MLPKLKANQIKAHFKVQLLNAKEEEEIKSSRAYIGQLINDIPMLSGDYKMGYEHEWWQYTSYWYEVLKNI